MSTIKFGDLFNLKEEKVCEFTEKVYALILTSFNLA